MECPHLQLQMSCFYFHGVPCRAWALQTQHVQSEHFLLFLLLDSVVTIMAHGPTLTQLPKPVTWKLPAVPYPVAALLQKQLLPGPKLEAALSPESGLFCLFCDRVSSNPGCPQLHYVITKGTFELLFLSSGTGITGVHHHGCRGRLF